jgi:hypothetical protein
MIGDPVTEESNRRDAEPVNLYAAAHTTRHQKRPLLHIARQFQHDVLVSARDAASTRPAIHDLQQASPTGTGSKVGLNVMPSTV